MFHSFERYQDDDVKESGDSPSFLDCKKCGHRAERHHNSVITMLYPHEYDGSSMSVMIKNCFDKSGTNFIEQAINTVRWGDDVDDLKDLSESGDEED